MTDAGMFLKLLPVAKRGVNCLAQCNTHGQVHERSSASSQRMLLVLHMRSHLKMHGSWLDWPHNFVVQSLYKPKWLLRPHIDATLLQRAIF